MNGMTIRLAISLFVAIAAPAAAQNAFKGLDSNAPVDFAADRIEVQDRADRVVFSGNVRAQQSRLTLTAARVTALYSNTNGVDVQRIDASGGVTVTTPSESARGNFGVYDINRRLITLVGNVQLRRAGSVVNGGRLVIDLTSGRATVDGGGAQGGSGGRVTGRFTVPQRTK